MDWLGGWKKRGQWGGISCSRVWAYESYSAIVKDPLCGTKASIEPFKAR